MMYAQGREELGWGGSTVIWQTEVAASGSSSSEPLHMQDEHKKASCSIALRMCLHVCVCANMSVCVCDKVKAQQSSMKNFNYFFNCL